MAYFSHEHADRACNFFERVLRHTQDEWAGKPFLLAPWEEEAVRAIFGWFDDDGNRLIQQVYLEVPKKSGKTEFCAGLILLVLLLDHNIGSQVYGAAAAQRQALNVFRAARTMINLDRALSKQFKVLASTHRILKRSDPNSFYAAIAADGDLSDGVNPSAVVGDEIHRWRTRKQLDNWDVLSLGGITRRQSLSIGITTAGVQSESPLAWRLHNKTLRVKEGVAPDPTFYGRIYAADRTDDWTDEKTWIKANPSLKQNGGFLDIAKLRVLYNSAKTDPEAQRSFRRYFLNLWDQKEKRAIDLAKWDCGKGPWQSLGLAPKQPEDTIRPLPAELLGRFINRRCWAGVDMSLTTDMSAVVFLFPNDDGTFDVLPFYWMPEGDTENSLKQRELRDGMPYRTWAEQGHIEITPGPVVDVREIRARLEWGDRMFDLAEICFDPSEARQLSVPMIDEGYQCIDIRQGYTLLSEPSKKILELVAKEALHHGGNPVLRWNAFCLATKEKDDKLMWVKPERHKDNARIDGLTATTNAMVRAMLGGATKSKYETADLRTI